MTAAHPVASRSPDGTRVCRASRGVPSVPGLVRGSGFRSPNQPDQERTTAYRDSSRSESRSDAHCATIVGDWEEPSGESRLRASPAPSLKIGPAHLRLVAWRASESHYEICSSHACLLRALPAPAKGHRLLDPACFLETGVKGVPLAGLSGAQQELVDHNENCCWRAGHLACLRDQPLGRR